MRWLITGGCGFLGTSLIRRLRSEGECSIRVIDNLSVGQKSDLAGVCPYSDGLPAGGAWSPGEVQLVEGDIRDEKLALLCTAGADIVVHLAANTGVLPSVENPRLDCITNVFGTFNYLEASRQNRVGRFVFASSGAPLGEVEPPIHEKLAPKPVSPYGASKLAGEGYCSAFFRTYGLRTVALRFGNVYGPGSDRKNSVVAKYIKRAMQGLPLEIYGDGKQTRDFIFIDDLVDAVCLAASAKIAGEVFQIATYRETTVLEIAEEVKRLFKEATGADVEITYKSALPGEVRRNYSDISKAKGMLGFAPKHDLRKGLKKTLDYFVQGRDAR